MSKLSFTGRIANETDKTYEVQSEIEVQDLSLKQIAEIIASAIDDISAETSTPIIELLTMISTECLLSDVKVYKHVQKSKVC